MKKLTAYLITLIAVSAAFAQQQNTEGIYKTAADFINHNISYAFDGKTKTGSIKVNDFFASPTIEVKAGGEKHKLHKSDIYGYTTGNNNNYRFVNNEVYQIVDTTGFYLYTAYMPGVGEKATFAEKDYFFSKDATSIPQPLTVENLHKEFASNTRFRYAADEFFTSNKKLTEYDSNLHCYKLKYLYAQSLK